MTTDMFQSAIEWTRTSITTLTFLSAGFLQTRYEHATGAFRNLSLFVLYAAATLLLLGLPKFIPMLLERSSLIRRLLFRRAFVEGCWVDATYDEDTNKIVSGSLSRWSYESGSIVATGWTYSVDRNPTGQFTMRSFKFDGLRMRYDFTWKIQGGGESLRSVENGYGELVFDPFGQRRTHYMGHFIDTHNRRRLSFRGRFVDENDLRVGTPSGRRTLVRNHAKAISRQLRRKNAATLVRTASGADW